MGETARKEHRKEFKTRTITTIIMIDVYVFSMAIIIAAVDTSTIHTIYNL